MLFKKYYMARSRAQFAFENFRGYFGATILDIGAGGSANFFRKHFGKAYTAVDVSESRNRPDHFVNFEKDPLPFADGAFETVFCFDCLEHCENIHSLFDELVRVSKRNVIISLPNAWPGLLRSLFWGQNISHVSGLPAENFSPGFRHKWNFNIKEAEEFAHRRSLKNGARVTAIVPVYQHVGEHFIEIPKIYPFLLRLSPAHFEVLADESKAADAGEADLYGKTEGEKSGGLRGLARTLVKSLGAINAYRAYYVLSRLTLGPLYLLEEAVRQLIWGWGSRYRYQNVFCRQVWIVIEKDGAAKS